MGTRPSVDETSAGGITVRHGRCRGIRKIQRFVQIADGVHPEPVHPFFDPPFHHRKDFFPKLGVGPVEIRLFFGKQVIIILSALGDIFPCAAAEYGCPVVGLFSVFGVPPDIIITFFIAAGRFGHFKPGVFIRRMIDNQVHNNPDAALMTLQAQLVPILHAAEFLHNLLVIGDIVAVIVIG